MFLIDNDKCSGCMACLNICSTKAIKMIEKECGHLYPSIDKSKCIKCGQCKIVCPSLGYINKKSIKHSFVFKSNKKQNLNSSSGGFAFSFSTYFLKEKQGVIYSSIFNNKEGVIYERITDLENLNRIKGSKYIHSKNYVYQNIKKDLEENKEVLVIGLSCVIAGIYKYIKKDYNNLHTIELICHGVPSFQTFSKFLIEQNVELSRIKEISFRNKTKYSLEIIDIDNEKIKVDNGYLFAFLSSFTIRKSCFNCQYIGNDRVADITIADAWGYEKNDEGFNLVLINNENKKEEIKKFLFDEDFVYYKIELKDIVNINKQVFEPSFVREKEIKKFNKIYDGTNLSASYKITVRKRELIERIKGSIKKMLKVKK